MNTLRLLLLIFIINAADSLIIHTSFGHLEGAEIGDYHLFKKIPFAKPPVGNLRFQKPEAAGKWDGIRSAIGEVLYRIKAI